VLEEGTPAPDFSLVSDSGETVSLSDFRGRPVVLYFYPKDDTPGCTKQACGLRDAYAEYQELGAVILGVSPDDEGSHASFKAKHGLPFTLLADSDRSVARAYDVWREKTSYGKTSMGIVRSTFVIDGDGTIVRTLYGVRPDGHAEKVLASLPT
jgi:peroxiredoxin Q/BCP